jgi:thiamine biosynthesis lipoprotein ApbE
MKIKLNNIELDLNLEQLKEIKKIQSEALKELKKCLEEVTKESKVWKPEFSDMYYYIASTGYALSCVYTKDNVDTYRLETGNCYRTREEAEKARDIIVPKLKARKRLNDYIKEKGYGVVTSLDRGHVFYLDGEGAVYSWESVIAYNDLPRLKKKEEANDVLANCAEDIKTLLMPY